MSVRPMPNGDSRRDYPSDDESSEEPSSAPEPKGLTPKPKGLTPKAKTVTPRSPAEGSSSSYEDVTEEEAEVPDRRRPKTPPTPDLASSESDKRYRDKRESFHERGRSPVKADSKGPRSANPKAAGPASRRRSTSSAVGAGAESEPARHLERSMSFGI